MRVYVVLDKNSRNIVSIFNNIQKATEFIVDKINYLEIEQHDVIMETPKTEMKSIIEVNEKVYDPLHYNSTLKFGKYKGQTVGDILQSAPDYLKWCIDNINLKLDECCIDLLNAAMEKFDEQR